MYLSVVSCSPTLCAGGAYMTSSNYLTVEEALSISRSEEPNVIYLGKPTNLQMGRRIKHACPVCGKIDYVTESEAIGKKKYCSSKCGHSRSGKWTEKIEWKCGYCGKVEYLEPYYAKTKKFCSRKCKALSSRSQFSEDRKKNRSSSEWRRIRKERMKQFCNICPITLEIEDLHVHHIDFDTTNNEEDNLIPLWTPYHTLIHARAGVDSFYEARDRAVLSVITHYWRAESQ